MVPAPPFQGLQTEAAMHTLSTRRFTRRTTRVATRLPATLLLLLASTLVLSACGRDDSRSVGQKVDSAVATTERKVSEGAAAAREAGRDAKQAVVTGAEAVGNSAKDVAITAEVKSRLARDTQLSALAIDVDTSSGRVVLRGNAPDTGSRGRATELARAVDGVVDVNNELAVQPR